MSTGRKAHRLMLVCYETLAASYEDQSATAANTVTYCINYARLQSIRVKFMVMQSIAVDNSYVMMSY
jgi:hypothetical protein